MSRGKISVADVVSYMDLLTFPISRWSQTESNDETERLWLQLCLVVLEGTPAEILRWMRTADPPRYDCTPSDLPVESRATAANLLIMIRVGQKYWGVGTMAGKNLAEIGTWVGNLDTEATISALNHLTHLIRERCAALEPELFRHATDQTARRIESWLGSISSARADVLVKRYGLNGQPGMTLEEIGQSRGVTRERVRQIESKAFQGLGPAAKDELLTSSKASSRSDALYEAFQCLSRRPGEDVHRIDDLLNRASLQGAWWPCGIVMLYEDVIKSTPCTNWRFVREWLTHRTDAIWLDDGMHFMKRGSENKSPYITAARKLLAIHDSVQISVVHEAVTDTWRSELWPECMLSVDHLRAFFKSSTLGVDQDCLVSTGPDISPDVLNHSEQHLVGALEDLGGVAALDELRERLPDLRQHGSTLSQTLYSRTPIVQHIGPSIFGIRGVAHDPVRVAILEDRALRNGHQWLDRSGWTQAARRSLQYRVSSRKGFPTRIRLPNDIADDLLGEDERHRPLVWRTPDAVEHSVGIQVTSAGTYFTGVRPVLNSLHAAGGNTIDMQVHLDGVWAVSLADETTDETVVIRLGRGWTSVTF